MEIQWRWDNNRRLILTCAGELGWDSMDLLMRRVSEALPGHDEPQVLMDLEAVDFVASAGIGTLLRVRKQVCDLGGTLVIARPAPLIWQLFTTIGMDRHIPVLATLDEARQYLDQVSCAVAANSST